MLGVASCATVETKPTCYVSLQASAKIFVQGPPLYVPGFEYMPWLALFHWPIKHTSGYSLSPLGTQKKNLGAASQTLLARQVRLP